MKIQKPIAHHTAIVLSLTLLSGCGGSGGDGENHNSDLVGAFTESWNGTADRTYAPETGDLPTFIQGEMGRWVLGDTVSEFPDCGPIENSAIIVEGALELTSDDSFSGCSDNVWVTMFTEAATNLDVTINPGLSIPLAFGTTLSFDYRGSLVNPKRGSSRCGSPPCGDTISFSLSESGGSQITYILHAAADAVSNTRHPSYGEIFLDPEAESYSRDLYADFLEFTNFSGDDSELLAINFEVNEHGVGSIDNIVISDTAP